MTTLPTHDAAHGHDDHAHHDHPPYLAHHWETPKQQFEAGKLGMWLFLATEVLLFGGLFVGYSVYRANHPELFVYSSHYLNTTMGAINTCVLILSSLTMAWGVTAAQQNKQGLLKVMLILTLCGALGFLGIKYVEYTHKFENNLYPGINFYETPEHAHMWVGGPPHDEHATGAAGDAAATQHGEGAATAPEHAGEGGATTAATPSTAPAATSGFEIETIAITPAQQPTTPPVEASTVKPASQGPQGLASGEKVGQPPEIEIVRDRHEAHVQPLQDPNRPHNMHMFFNIYYMMTGLHGIHVVIGMIVITWLLVKSFKGHFSSEYFTPVDLGGLYWHVVDLIWIFLFPLFYLI